MAVLPACGTGKQENIDQGMKLIEQLNYEEALKCFDAALLNKEDARLSHYRGQGLAYMGLTEYDKAAEYLERRSATVTLMWSRWILISIIIWPLLTTSWVSLTRPRPYTIRLRRFAPRKKRRIT